MMDVQKYIPFVLITCVVMAVVCRMAVLKDMNFSLLTECFCEKKISYGSAATVPAPFVLGSGGWRSSMGIC
jgi:hypothetical protein